MTEPLILCRAAGLFSQAMKRKYTGTAEAMMARPMAVSTGVIIMGTTVMKMVARM